MALKHKWHRQAQDDFDKTLAYILNEFGEKAAENFFSKVTERVEILCYFPQAGPHYQDLFFHGNEVRIFRMEKTSIVYCYDDKTLHIIAFWNNRSAGSLLIDE